MIKKLALLLLFFSNTEIQAQLFYGITNSGGTYNGGTIFSTDSLGNNFQSLYSFKVDIEGSPNPSAFCYVPATGKYYACGISVLYEWDYATNTYTKLINFDGINAGSAVGSLILASNGKIYGLTSTGGLTNSGVLFEFDPLTSLFIKKVDFNAPSGQWPSGGLVEDGSGNLLGMLQKGPGSTLGGCIVKYNLAADSVVAYTYFDSATTGGSPVGTLYKASNGSYYGMCLSGGANGLGTVFEYNLLTNTIINHYDFTWTDGTFPTGVLTEIAGGKLYGFTNSGGASSAGTLFEFNIISNTYTTKLDLDGYLMGGNPQSGFTYDVTSGRLYACTDYAGLGYGGIVEYNPSTNSLVTKYVFPTEETGSQPACIPTILPGGIILGTTGSGGLTGAGTIFSYSLVTGVHTRLIDFQYSSTGRFPEKGLTLADNGKLYSVASSGGVYNKGVLYEFDIPTNNYTKKFDFDGINGSSPSTTLLKASNGKLYGCTFSGGINYDSGVLYEYDPSTSVYTKKFDFNAFSDCGGFWDRLVECAGDIYGTASVGGVNNGGVIFKYNILTNSMSFIYQFDGPPGPNGTAPKAGMAFNGIDKLVSVTNSGGIYGLGAVYDYNIISNTYTKLYDINYTGPGSTGWDVEYSPILHSDGSYYGTTHMGQGYVGCTGNGSLYKFNPITNVYTTIQFFDGWNGNTPECTLLEGPNGALYGSAAASYTAKGVLFEFIPSSSTYTIKHSFNQIDGAIPMSHLLYVNNMSIILSNNSTIKEENILIYPNPANNRLYIANIHDTYTVEIVNPIGQKIKTFYNSDNYIDIGDVSPGIYLLRILHDGKITFSKKILIQH